MITAYIAFMLLLGQKFYADDPIMRDNDTTIAVNGIARHKLSDYYDFLQHTFGKPGERTNEPAANVNTLGEAPDSTWFQNRRGMFPMSLAELARGPNTSDGPSTEQPWQVLAVKTEGITPGLRVRDSRGDVYLLKFDSPDHPELATGAEIISTKFFHAIGYHVPENYLASFKRDQLQADESLKEDVNKILARVHQRRDGSFRVLASKLIKGEPIGPFQYFGTRPDDPNDIFRHENRRELRGLRVFSAWLNHTDTKAGNSLDVVVEEHGRRFVRHYLIDFGSTLGSGGVGPKKARHGWEYLWERKAAIGRLATLGLWDRRWSRVKYPESRSVARFESRDFRPEEWKPHYPNPAFRNLTDGDAYWAAKIVMSFTEEEIRAIVKTAQLSDSGAEAYLVRTLLERRNKIGRSWLTRLSSFDRFEITAEGDLSFDHLASLYGFSPRPGFRVEWFTFDNASRDRELIEKFLPESNRGYFAAEITSSEGLVEVYVRNMDGRPKIVGIERSPAAAGKEPRTNR